MKQFLSMTLMALLIAGLSGCSSPFDRLKTAYDEGDFYEVSSAVSDGLNDPETKPKVLEFIQAHAAELEQRSVQYGDNLIANKSESAISYFDVLGGLVSKLQGANATGLDLPRLSKLMSSKKETAIQTFVITEQESGLGNFTTKRFRASIDNFQNVLKYRQSAEASSKIPLAKRLARRQIALVSFTTPTHDVGLKDIVDLFKTGDVNFAHPYLEFAGVQVNDSFASQLMPALNSSKSEFMGFSMDSAPADNDFIQYYVQGQITGSQNHSDRSAVIDGKPTTVKTYSCNLTMSGKVYLKSTGKAIYSFTVSAAKGSESRDGNLNESGTVNSTVSDLANSAAQEILSAVDHDLDPYSESIVVPR